jgi:hypothetical protein
MPTYLMLGAAEKQKGSIFGTCSAVDAEAFALAPLHQLLYVDVEQFVSDAGFPELADVLLHHSQPFLVGLLKIFGVGDYLTKPRPLLGCVNADADPVG